jgi:uncharacterized OsmC-like protein
MYTATLENKGDSKYFVTSKEYKFIIDTEGNGISPLDTLVASLGACVGVYIRYYAAKNTLPFKEFTIKVDAEPVDKPVRLAKINVTVIPKDGTLDEATKEKLLKFVKNCPVHNTLKNNPEIDINFK